MSAVLEIEIAIDATEEEVPDAWFTYRRKEIRVARTTDGKYAARCPICTRRYGIPGALVVLGLDGSASILRAIRCPTASCGFYVMVEGGKALQLTD